MLVGFGLRRVGVFVGFGYTLVCMYVGFGNGLMGTYVGLAIQVCGYVSGVWQYIGTWNFVLNVGFGIMIMGIICACYFWRDVHSYRHGQSDCKPIGQTYVRLQVYSLIIDEYQSS